jgi:hypothetical protein
MAAVMTKPMNMTEIKAKAKDLGINPGKMKKVDLVRAIQMAECNNPCYGTNDGSCPWTECCFMGDCHKVK